MVQTNFTAADMYPKAVVANKVATPVQKKASKKVEKPVVEEAVVVEESIVDSE